MITAEIRALEPQASAAVRASQPISGLDLAAGREEGSAPWESYVDDPADVDESDLRTEVFWPIA